MNTFVILAIFVAAASACPDMPPAECSDMEMPCWGGMDPEGCPMPDFCVPMNYKGNNGFVCPTTCPTMCAPGDSPCPGGIDENGCLMKDTCIPQGEDCELPM